MQTSLRPKKSASSKRRWHSANHYGGVLLLVIGISLPAAAALRPVGTHTPPSQIVALSYAYQSMSHHPQRQAIIRADYRIQSNGMTTVWMELLTQSLASTQTPAPITRTTIELEIQSNSAGELHTTAKRTLSSEKWPQTDLQEALAKTRLRSLVYHWLMLLEQPDINATALLAHTQAQATTTLDPATGPRLTGLVQINNWFTAQRQGQKKFQQQVEDIEITPLTTRHYRLDFAVNWRARGSKGALRVGRKEYRWEVELGTDEVIRINHIQEQNALPLPDTGTRVFC